MKQKIMEGIVQQMLPYLNNVQLQKLQEVLEYSFYNYEISSKVEETEDDSQKLIDAFVYVMHEERRLGIPTSAYVSTCKFGYTIFGFDFKHLDEAYEKSLKGASNNEN